MRLPEAAVEAIDELVDVRLQAMRSHRTVEGTEQEALEVGDDDVHPRQPLIGLFGRRDLGDVGSLHGEPRERRERIGMTDRVWLQTPLREVDDVALLKRVEHLNGDEAWLAVRGLLDRHQQRRAPTATAG